MRMLVLCSTAILALCAPSLAGLITFKKDIPYLGTDRSEKMDAYLPHTTSPVPAVLLIHGGGWEKGDKAAAREKNIGNNLARNGYAVFSINYLLNSGDNIA